MNEEFKIVGGDAEDDLCEQMDINDAKEQICDDLRSLKKLNETSEDTPSKVVMDEILDSVQALVDEEFRTLEMPSDEDIGGWVYRGDDADIMRFTLKLLFIRLRLKDIERQFDALVDDMNGVFDDVESVPILLNSIATRVALEKFELCIQKVYKASCERKERSEGEGNDIEEDA